MIYQTEKTLRSIHPCIPWSKFQCLAVTTKRRWSSGRRPYNTANLSLPSFVSPPLILPGMTDRLQWKRTGSSTQRRRRLAGVSASLGVLMPKCSFCHERGLDCQVSGTSKRCGSCTSANRPRCDFWGLDSWVLCVRPCPLSIGRSDGYSQALIFEKEKLARRRKILLRRFSGFVARSAPSRGRCDRHSPVSFETSRSLSRRRPQLLPWPLPTRLLLSECFLHSFQQMK